jgi:gas vesicle protein
MQELMSEKNGFGNGFIFGSIVGGVIGGLLGTLLANKNTQQSSSDRDRYNSLDASSAVEFNTEESIEMARHGLEDKIAQLNLAIDDVRQQLSSVTARDIERDEN